MLCFSLQFSDNLINHQLSTGELRLLLSPTIHDLSVAKEQVFESQLFGLIMVFVQTGELDISLTIGVRPLKAQWATSKTETWVFFTIQWHLTFWQICTLWFSAYNPRRMFHCSTAAPTSLRIL